MVKTLKLPKLPQFDKRPAHTLLFITEVKTFRVDTDRAGILISDVEQIQHGCKNTAQLAKTFAKIADSTGPLGRKLWILFLRLPSLLLSLPTMQIHGVDEATLTQALQFEAEGMTGVSSMDMRVAYHFVKAENEMSDYWLVQIEQLAWDDLVKAVKLRKTKLAGLLHPGALPVFMHDAQATEWLRIEAWSTQLVAICRNESRLSLQALSYENNHWRVELEHWLQELGELPVSETLANNRVEVLPTTKYVFKLNENSDLAVWLGLWAQTLIAERAAGVALLKQTSKINVDLTWMVGSGAAALLLCSLHALWFLHQQAYYDEETQRLSKMDKAMTDLGKKIAAGNDERALLETKLNKISADSELVPNVIRSLQQRPALLLQALAAGRDEQVIIESFESQLQDVTIEGVALKQQLGNSLVSYLSESLKDLFWKVESPTIKNMALFESEPGPWSFKFNLVDTGVPSLALPEKKDGKK